MNAKHIVAGCLVACLGAGLTTLASFNPSPDAAYNQQRILHESATVAYRLPVLEDLPMDANATVVDQAQMMVRAARVGVGEADMHNPAQAMEHIVHSVEADVGQRAAAGQQVVVENPTAEHIQQALQDANGATVVVQGVAQITRSIAVPAGAHLDATGATWDCAIEGPLFVLDGVQDVRIEGVDVAGGATCGIVAVQSNRIVVQNCRINDMQDKAVVFGDGVSTFVLDGCQFEGNAHGGVLVGGSSNTGIVRNCTVSNNLGTSNWMAGIVLTNVPFGNLDNLWDGFPEHLHFPLRNTLADVVACPHNVVLQDNTVEDNNSSGMYLDGVYRCFVDGNAINGNDKEGMCLDYGALACFVHDNTIQRNGQRSRQSDWDLEMDWVLDFGRMEDGTAASKLPAISLDNAAFNVVEANTISHNYGGGVKAVRCAMRNAIVCNAITECNDGENDVFQFFGIELGNAPGPEDATEMDYLPDYQNYVYGNRIVGHHLAAIFIGNSCTGNVVEGNRIEGSGPFAILQVSDLSNSLDGNRYSGFSFNRSILPF